ncbi:MAG: hypothetical protein A2Y10_12185 [Planctomycetes bacterium GWF2_41_51]|nr:MAG: hypothetical protein A2Y10_12185 [Planctomycetes bacterium GWF2_41_51]HBG28705.1 hypothetical protein [Phycisphaerales bacterium]
MNIVTKQRKTNFLSSPALDCLRALANINVSAGCVHNCLYCYTKGYSIYPGENTIELYENIVAKVTDEIKRKRKKPRCAYFCSSCDPFQPIPRIQQITFDLMKALLENNINVQFVTKGIISDKTFELFNEHPSKIFGHIGLITVEEKILKIFEPGAASPPVRLNQLERLTKMGIEMSVRCDPIIHGLTDSDEQLQKLFSAIANTGCKRVSISFLFLRPAIISSFKQNISDKETLDKILKPYSANNILPIGLSSKGTVLPPEIRKAGFEKIEKIAAGFGITTRICGCKNNDITTQKCYLTREIMNSPKLLFS